MTRLKFLMTLLIAPTAAIAAVAANPRRVVFHGRERLTAAKLNQALDEVRR